MKVLMKDQLTDKKLLKQTLAERDILMKMENPYIIKLYYAFQDPQKLFFVLDFVNGGELFTYLQKEKKFSE